MFVKICGITQVAQAKAIVKLFERYQMFGHCALGLIAVPSSPRYVDRDTMKAIASVIPPQVLSVAVYVNRPPADIVADVSFSGITAVQLHGSETPDDCRTIRQLCPKLTLWKALRPRNRGDLAQAHEYEPVVDGLLIDAYHPHQSGGTGQTADWELLAQFQPTVPWLLAGGLTPENVPLALAAVSPDGIDLSSGVESQPGDKDLQRVDQLLRTVTAMAIATD